MISEEKFVAKAKKAIVSDTGGQIVDGVKYLTFGLVSDFAEQLKKIRELDIRDDDVLQVGFPRSGNHWNLELVSMILRQTTTFSDQTLLSTLLENQGEAIGETINAMASPRQIPTHLRMHRLPVQAVQKRIKIVYVIRNPKDVLVSMFRIFSSFGAEASRFHGTWADFFTASMAGEIACGLWFDHVLALEDFTKTHPECPVYISSYERLKHNPIQVIKELCLFLNKPVDIAEEIAAVTEFARMKKTLAEGKLKVYAPFYKDGTIDCIIHSGSISGWKNYFTVAQNEQFDQAFEEKMSGCQLATLVRDYLK